MEKKFILTDKFVINSFGIKLFQIKCTKSFKYAQKGDFGGYVEKEGNLDQENDAWVFGNARVSAMLGCLEMLGCPSMLGCPTMLGCPAMLGCPEMLI